MCGVSLLTLKKGKHLITSVLSGGSKLRVVYTRTGSRRKKKTQKSIQVNYVCMLRMGIYTSVRFSFLASFAHNPYIYTYIHTYIHTYIMKTAVSTVFFPR